MWHSKNLAIAPLTLAALLGLGSSAWLPKTAVAQSVSQANTARVNLVLNRQPNESYDTFIRRAESVVRNAAIGSFNQNRSVGAVAITVVGQNEGSAAPILALQVNRQDWTRNPNPQRWATYFKSARSLLRLDNNPIAQQGQPNGVPSGSTGFPGSVNVPVNGNVVPGTTGVPGTNQAVPGTMGVPGTTGVPGTNQAVPGTIGVPGTNQAVPGTTGVPGTNQAVPGTTTAPGTNFNNGTTGTPGTTFNGTTAPGTNFNNGTTGTPGTTFNGTTAPGTNLNNGMTGTPGTTFNGTTAPGTNLNNGTTGTPGTTFNGTTAPGTTNGNTGVSGF